MKMDDKDDEEYKLIWSSIAGMLNFLISNIKIFNEDEQTKYQAEIENKGKFLLGTIEILKQKSVEILEKRNSELVKQKNNNWKNILSKIFSLGFYNRKKQIDKKIEKINQQISSKKTEFDNKIDVITSTKEMLKTEIIKIKTEVYPIKLENEKLNVELLNTEKALKDITRKYQKMQKNEKVYENENLNLKKQNEKLGQAKQSADIKSKELKDILQDNQLQIEKLKKQNEKQMILINSMKCSNENTEEWKAVTTTKDDLVKLLTKRCSELQETRLLNDSGFSSSSEMTKESNILTKDSFAQKINVNEPLKKQTEHSTQKHGSFSS